MVIGYVLTHHITEEEIASSDLKDPVNRRIWFLFEFLNSKLVTTPDLSSEEPEYDLLDEKYYHHVQECCVESRYRLRINTVMKKPFLMICRKFLCGSEDISSVRDGDAEEESSTSSESTCRHDLEESFKFEGDAPPDAETASEILKHLKDEKTSLTSLFRLLQVKEADKPVEVFRSQDDVIVDESRRSSSLVKLSVDKLDVSHIGVPFFCLDWTALEDMYSMYRFKLPCELMLCLSAFYSHYHPHPDGNGRMMRLLMEYVMEGPVGSAFSSLLTLNKGASKEVFASKYYSSYNAQSEQLLEFLSQYKLVSTVEGSYTKEYKCTEKCKEYQFLWNFYDGSESSYHLHKLWKLSMKYSKLLNIHLELARTWGVTILKGHFNEKNFMRKLTKSFKSQLNPDILEGFVAEACKVSNYVVENQLQC
ncbi:hypothetical protein ADUPG1_012671 [Aduncisulcus paluster]|uniref:Uncharacterized protein n=1 Tax=Aduncisulcus paluster TaxID=2918883 RepID=A0ABQ5K091_9EUKA|nr:hypothetical protein ADUPG1_012671 [Aduncisulcus paluster]